MPLTLSRSSEAATEPITIAEMNQHITGTAAGVTTEGDTFVTDIMKRVREYLEVVTQRQFISTTWIYALDAFPEKTIIEIPRPPLVSITHIKYQNTSNVETTLATTEYASEILSEPGRVYLLPDHAWPATYNIPNAVKITYVAGYANAASVPRAIKSAIYQLTADMYRYRREISVEDFIKLHPQTQRIIWSIRNLTVR